MVNPIRVIQLLDGGEAFGVPHGIARMLEAHDPARVRVEGLFLGRGPGYELLAPRFAAAHDLGVGPLFPLRRPGGVKYDPLFLSRRAVVGGRCLIAASGFLRRERPHVIHTRRWELALLAWLASRGLPVRRIWHAHGTYQFGGRRSTWFERFARRSMHCIVANSRFTRDSFPESLRGMIRVVHNGAPVERLRREARPGEFRRRFGVQPDEKLVGIFGAVVPIKGHIYFLEAARHVLDATSKRRNVETPNLNGCGEGLKVRFAIVGGTTDAYERMGALDELAVNIRRLELEGQVIQTGYLPGATAYMGDFDVIAMPSAWTSWQKGEGFGNVMIESMAMGVATIATRWAAVPEVIEDGVDGLLVPPREGRALGEAMLRLLRDDALRRRLGAAGYDKVRREFDARVVAARLEDVYEEEAAELV